MSTGHASSSGGPGKSAEPIKVCLECRSAYRTRRDTCPRDGSPLISGKLEPGAILAGKYRIGEEIGRGGMGEVYRAEHIIMGKTVAVKVINPVLSITPAFLDMFKAEARHASTFKHENAVIVHDFGESQGRFYLVMELLEGESLKRMLKEVGTLPPERALAILLKVSAAVAAAHKAGIVHLDLKCENVFVRETAAGDEVKVLDFGLARLQGEEPLDLGDGMTVGTIGYMAPEQIGGGHVDERTDIYAIGVMAFEMLVGKLPFPGRTKDDILNSQLKDKREKFPKTRVLRALPKETKAAIMAAVTANPARRPETVDELAESFRLGLEGIRRAAGYYARRHEPAEARPRKAAKRAGGGISSVFSIFRRRRKGPEPPEGMVLVPAGDFLMGINAGPRDESPMVRVPLPSYFIDITPVTNREYARFVDATDHRPPTTWKTVSFPPGTGDLPVTGVTWQDAMDYCEWAGKRLPTEAEWEKAARGTDTRIFPWGNKWQPTFANWGGNPRSHGSATTQPVGTFPNDRSPYGCLDMAGNVKEWTASWYKPYGPTDYRNDDFGEKFKVVRGGSYLSQDRDYLRTTSRSHARPEEAGDIGFRTAMDVVG